MSTAERLNDLTLRSFDQMKVRYMSAYLVTFLLWWCLQAVNDALDDYEGQLKDFVAKQHFRHDRMQSAYTAAKTKWTETNYRMNTKLHLLKLTILFYENAKKVCLLFECQYSTDGIVLGGF